MDPLEAPLARDTTSVTGEARTFVVEVVGGDVSRLVDWASGMIGHGFQAAAVAILDNSFFIVLTCTSTRNTGNISVALSRQLHQFSARVSRVQPLNRLLCEKIFLRDLWVDETLEKACKEQDRTAILHALPALRNVIDQEGFFDSLAGHLRGEKALCDAVCDAAAFGEPSISLKCSVCGCRPAVECHLPEPFNKPLCRRHVPSLEHKSVLIKHELENAHTFGTPHMDLECSVCNTFPAARCTCGAQRCKRHFSPTEAPHCCPLPTTELARRSAHRIVWAQSKHEPEPFYVKNSAKMRDEEKMEWLLMELPPNPSLEEFAAAYMRTFQGTVADRQKKRSACLNLYRRVDPEFKATKECQLEPAQLEAFQRVFDPAAPSRCRWCGKAFEAPTAKERPRGEWHSLCLRVAFCSDRCFWAERSPSPVCAKCGSPDLGEPFPNPLLENCITQFLYHGKCLSKCLACSAYSPQHAVRTDLLPPKVPSGGQPPHKNRRRS